MVMDWPCRMRTVPLPTPSTAGIPYSRATMDPCARMLPHVGDQPHGMGEQLRPRGRGVRGDQDRAGFHLVEVVLRQDDAGRGGHRSGADREPVERVAGRVVPDLRFLEPNGRGCCWLPRESSRAGAGACALPSTRVVGLRACPVQGRPLPVLRASMARFNSSVTTKNVSSGSKKVPASTRRRPSSNAIGRSTDQV